MSSSSSRCGVDPLGQLARQRPRLADQLLQGAAGDVALVVGEDGVAPLVGSAHRLILSARARRPAQAREMYSPLRVSTRTVSPSSMKSGTWTTTPGLQRRRLVAAAGGGVALQAGVGLGDLHLDRARHLDVARLFVDEEDVDLGVRQDPLHRVAELLRGDLDLVVVAASP